MNDDMIMAAADWWTKAISNPKFDNGDDSPQGGMAMVLANMAHQSKSDAGLEKFRETFVRRMKTEAEDGRAPHVVGVDYGPDSWLSSVAQEAGIATGITDWPWKTSMHLGDGKVTVRAGYHAPSEQIFPAESS